ncbi:response regulator, partial [Halorubrum trueperi]
MSTNLGTDDRGSLLPDSKTIRVLHVEDDRDFANLVAAFLTSDRDRFCVDTETDPKQALSALQDADHEFDCVVSDYDMPGLNGLDVLQRIRDEYPNLPFILFTGKGSEEIASEAITAGVT